MANRLFSLSVLITVLLQNVSPTDDFAFDQPAEYVSSSNRGMQSSKNQYGHGPMHYGPKHSQEM